MKLIAVCVGLLVSGCTPAFAQTMPPGVIPVTVPAYGVDLAIWASNTTGMAVMSLNQRTTGATAWQQLWYAISSSNFRDEIAAAGSPALFVQSKVPVINGILAQKFPPLSSAAPDANADPVGAVAYALSHNFALVVHADGSASFGAKP